MKRLLAVVFVFVVLFVSVFVDAEPTPPILYLLGGAFLIFLLIWVVVYLFRRFVEKEKLE